MDEIAPGLWHWTARHPEWHPAGFGSEVGSYALRVRGGDLLLIDPLLPEDGVVTERLDALAAVATTVHVYITIPYHVRSTAAVVARCGGRRVRVWGERRLGRRLPGIDVGIAEPGAALPFGGRCFAIGRPRRAEQPLWIEDHAALAFGDAVVETGGGLRIWAQDRLDERRLTFYRERFAPTLEPLLAPPVRSVLVTHGAPVPAGGKDALRRAIATEPWYHHG
jgi:hypothetical protein